MVFILVKAEVEESAHGTAGLRYAVHDGFLNGPSEGVFCARVVLQKRGEIAHRCEAEPENQRVLCRINKLVDVVGVEPAVDTDLCGARSAWKRRGGAVCESPLMVGNQLAWVLLMHALSQDGTRVVEADSLIACRCRAGIGAAAEVLRCCRASS